MICKIKIYYPMMIKDYQEEVIFNILEHETFLENQPYAKLQQFDGLV